MGSRTFCPRCQIKVLRNFFKALVAVVAGNLVYFFVLMPLLPAAGQHRIFQLDWGLVVDFWVCLVVYGIIELVLRRKRARAGSH